MVGITVRRWFILFFRGRPFSGSNRRWWTGVAEALIAAALLFVGVVLLVLSVTLAVLYSTPQALYISGRFFALQLLLSFSLIGLGTYWIARLLWNEGVSAERRGALATRANELELINELRRGREDLPTVPRDRFPPRPGEALPFRLLPSPRNVWGLITAAIFSVIFLALLTILLLIVTITFQTDPADWVDRLGKRLSNSQLGRIPDRPWLAVAFSAPIGAAAGWSIYQFFRQLIKLTGIGATSIEFDQYPLIPGENYRVFLSQSGRVRLKLLDVNLVCQEEVTFNQGTDIRTERAVVFEQRLFRGRGISLRPGRPFETEFELIIPAHAIHSFKSQNNRVKWKIVVTGQAKNWPRLNRNFVVSVHPVPELEMPAMAKT